MKRIVIFMIMVMMLGMVLAACGPVSCNDQTRVYQDEIHSLSNEWDQANKLANSTPRIQLATVIQTLQVARNKVDNLQTPACAQKAQQLLLNYMDETIDGYMSFMADDQDATVQAHFTKASLLFDQWSEAFAQLAEH
jgi:uncharacterized membrane-anchored protein YhcB (DUF1043 family)